MFSSTVQVKRLGDGHTYQTQFWLHPAESTGTSSTNYASRPVRTESPFFLSHDLDHLFNLSNPKDPLLTGPHPEVNYAEALNTGVSYAIKRSPNLPDSYKFDLKIGALDQWSSSRSVYGNYEGPSGLSYGTSFLLDHSAIAKAAFQHTPPNWGRELVEFKQNVLQFLQRPVAVNTNEVTEEIYQEFWSPEKTMQRIQLHEACLKAVQDIIGGEPSFLRTLL